MLKKVISLILLFVWANTCQAADVRVVKHVADGDTLVLENNEKVRLIGVDTPELGDKDRNARNAGRNGISRRTVNEFAVKAKTFAENAIEGQQVRLDYDWQRSDKYGRTLAYVYRVPDDFFLNAEIIKKGYGFAYTRFPFKYQEEFKGYENEARANKKGLWQ